MNEKIVVNLLSDDQPYQLAQAESARSVAERLGVNLEIQFNGTSLITQTKQLTEQIELPEENRPDGLIVHSVTMDGLEGLARRAVQAGIGWVLIESIPPYLDFLAEEFPKVPISTATDDNVEMGRMQGRQCQLLLPKGGRILYLEGPGASGSTILRRKGFMEAIGRSAITVGKTLAADWTSAGIEISAGAWLRLKTSFRPDLVASQNDNMALGCRNAMLSLYPKWADIPVLGIDGLAREGVRMVKEGVLAATVVRPLLAGFAVETMVAGLRSQSTPARVSPPIESFPSYEDLETRRR